MISVDLNRRQQRFLLRHVENGVGKKCRFVMTTEKKTRDFLIKAGLLALRAHPLTHTVLTEKGAAFVSDLLTSYVDALAAAGVGPKLPRVVVRCRPPVRVDEPDLALAPG